MVPVNMYYFSVQVEAALGGKWHAFPSCHLEEWQEAVMRVVASQGKTPLLIVDEPHTYTVGCVCVCACVCV